MKTVAIVQGRMASSRLPDKILKEIEGKPMLAWVVDRARTGEAHRPGDGGDDDGSIGRSRSKPTAAHRVSLLPRAVCMMCWTASTRPPN